MGKLCKKCGMESDRDDLCTWCNADLREPAAPAKEPVAAPGTPPSATTPAAATKPRRAPMPEPKSAAWRVPVIVGAIVVALLVYPLVISGLRATAPPAAPGDWKTFTSKDNSFTGSYPSGWGEPSNSGSAGTYVMVEWKGGRLCKVQVKGSGVAGSVGDVGAAAERAAAGAGVAVSIERSADGTLFDFYNRTGFAKERPGYDEGAIAEAHTFAGVRSAFAEYSYTRRIGLITVKMKGMRWASAQGEYGYNVWAEAPEKHWEAFRPVAEQIVGSVKLGGRV